MPPRMSVWPQSAITRTFSTIRNHTTSSTTASGTLRSTAPKPMPDNATRGGPFADLSPQPVADNGHEARASPRPAGGGQPRARGGRGPKGDRGHHPHRRDAETDHAVDRAPRHVREHLRGQRRNPV